MAQPLRIPLPPSIDLWGGCIVRVTALDPATGDVVAGVDVQNVTLQVVQTAGDSSQLTQGSWRLVPGPGA